ncbi:integrase [Pseudochelatococcus lubricantis]|uniref:Integrase n=1 Tax=Pseudochelatococcus lubricantis TaxID=1538102 RepID=A0ABX0V3S9_9HYPH|nr:DUF6538 domain-containing protein [Pseudochelatococcus lubricantis]NIJ58465.1 integrase [Pseudochelatococcus lubricantis]
MSRPALGRYLEWNGGTIRVVIHVPKDLQAALGATKLKQSLHTDSPKTAEAIKWRVIADLKHRLVEARKGTKGDPLVAEAMQWREALNDPRADDNQSAAMSSLLTDRAEEIEEARGFRAAKTFADIAQGKATPILSLLPDWFAESRFAGRTRQARDKAVRSFTAWASGLPAPISAIEAVTRKVAGDYKATFIKAGTNAGTANKDLGSLSAYWSWLMDRGHLPQGLQANPWQGQRVAKEQTGHAKPEDGQGNKRPFTDKEVTILLNGLRQDPPTGAGEALPDMSTFAALEGARIGEIATLRVRHVDLDKMEVYIPGEKTENAGRRTALHSGLREVMAARIQGKTPDAYVFHELPDQKPDEDGITMRGKGAPASQAFTRIRRKLGVDDMLPGARQSRIDFHSWRRWFIAKAVQALQRGANGFDSWTIADVVGHSKDDMPLPMTMGLYPGRASMEAMRACVEAVKLPSISVREERPETVAASEAAPAATADILSEKSEAALS